MTHQVLEKYNSLPTVQTTNRVPHNCRNKLSYLASTYSAFENSERYSVRFEIANNGPIYDSI